MSDANPKADAFFKGAKKWQKELEALRAILQAAPVTEDFKWRSPCYTYEGGNVAALWGLKDKCAVAFFKGALMKDPEGILEAPGENSRSMRTIKFESVAEINRKKSVLKKYIREAIDVEKAGLKVDFKKDDLAPPDELTAKFNEDPEFKAAFKALTPGRQRGYTLYFSQAKQSKTRISRIEKAVPRILEGKGMHDR